MRKLFVDAEWNRRIDEVKTWEDVYLVIEAFVKVYVDLSEGDSFMIEISAR